ncbi:protein scarlet-like isoform X1 [Cimex lectularius]|uniref:ABC transporter domain-containing protein n=2 Tax=Cimex lectularius TaxID=79782 RepID=A0A8I6SL66_CIMLE|nr:protein scarlet-like isoform X1 [Cimex lectularius]
MISVIKMGKDANENKQKKGLTLSWHNLSVWVEKKDEDKSNWFKVRYYDCKILRKVSGIAKPGELMSIMGPSGAGKTTLLATISQRLIGGVKGKILVNGKKIDKELMLKISGFVAQHDLATEILTVYEHLQFMARLKLHRHLTNEERTLRILSMISEMGLVDIKYSRLSNISGGEKKRVSMAVQLLTDPSILFCDEPTTGLDSFSAFSIVEQLRRIAATGKAIICTIHQPASGMFEMFDHIYFLVAGGRVSLDCNVTEAAEYLRNVGIVCPPSYNFAEFLVSKLAIGDDAESQIRVNKLCRYYRESKDYENLLKNLEIEQSYGREIMITETPVKFTDSICKPSSDFGKYLAMKRPKHSTQLSWLLWRASLELIRKPQQHILRFALYLLMALVISTPYTEINVDQEGIQNIQGFLYLVIVETTFTFTYSVVHTFPAELAVMMREVGNGIYSPGPYYISKLIMLLPRAVIEPAFFSIITFCIPGLFGGLMGFFLFCIPVIMCSIAATSYGCLISSVFDNIEKGSMFSVPYEQVALLFCGIYLSLSDVPFHFAWVKYVSIFYYGIEALSILQWSFIFNIPCSSTPDRPCINSGNGVLEHFGYSKSNFTMDMLGLLSIYCCCHVVGFIFIWKKCKRNTSY